MHGGRSNPNRPSICVVPAASQRCWPLGRRGDCVDGDQRLGRESRAHQFAALVRAGRATQQIGHSVGLSGAAVRAILQGAGMSASELRKHRLLLTAENLAALVAGKTTNEVGAQVGLKGGAVRHILSRDDMSASALRAQRLARAARARR
jgi:hypothetical protein